MRLDWKDRMNEREKTSRRRRWVFHGLLNILKLLPKSWNILEIFCSTSQVFSQCTLHVYSSPERFLSPRKRRSVLLSLFLCHQSLRWEGLRRVNDPRCSLCSLCFVFSMCTRIQCHRWFIQSYLNFLGWSMILCWRKRLYSKERRVSCSLESSPRFLTISVWEWQSCMTIRDSWLEQLDGIIFLFRKTRSFNFYVDYKTHLTREDNLHSADRSELFRVELLILSDRCSKRKKSLWEHNLDSSILLWFLIGFCPGSWFSTTAATRVLFNGRLNERKRSRSRRIFQVDVRRRNSLWILSPKFGVLHFLSFMIKSLHLTRILLRRFCCVYPVIPFPSAKRSDKGTEFFDPALLPRNNTHLKRYFICRTYELVIGS